MERIIILVAHDGEEVRIAEGPADGQINQVWVGDDCYIWQGRGFLPEGRIAEPVHALRDHPRYVLPENLATAKRLSQRLGLAYSPKCAPVLSVTERRMQCNFAPIGA
jgi:hypothetical protein